MPRRLLTESEVEEKVSIKRSERSKVDHRSAMSDLCMRKISFYLKFLKLNAQKKVKRENEYKLLNPS